MIPMGTASPKPLKGEFLFERRTRRHEVELHEDREMRAAKRRDGAKCRRPRCRFAKLRLPIDPCHKKDSHRGSGGNPAKNRTIRKWIISLCRGDHALYDAGDLLIDPLSTDDFDGPCDFSERHPETGTFLHIGTETRIGLSVTRDGR